MAKNQEYATHLLKSKLQNRPHNATKINFTAFIRQGVKVIKMVNKSNLSRLFWITDSCYSVGLQHAIIDNTRHFQISQKLNITKYVQNNISFLLMIISSATFALSFSDSWISLSALVCCNQKCWLDMSLFK